MSTTSRLELTQPTYRSDLRIDGDENQEFLIPMIQMLRPLMEPDRDKPLPYGALVRSQINIGMPLDWLHYCQPMLKRRPLVARF